jgi:DNA-binding NarL/FixJ family response regulator
MREMPRYTLGRASHRKESLRAAGTEEFEPMRVLIAEDEALVALELEELLLDEGFEIVGRAADAVQAIELGRRHRPDVALLDLNLADELTGPRIAKTLVHERLATVVFVTGQANVLPSDLHGAFGVIEKPCVGRAMVEALRFLSSYLCGKATKRAVPPVLRLASSPQQ